MALVTVGWSNLDLNEKLLKTDYQSKRCPIRVEHKLQTIQLPPEAFALGARLRRPGVWISVIFHMDLLTNEAMFTGWNPSGTAVYLMMKLWFLVQPEHKWLTLFPIPSKKPSILWLRMFILFKEKIFLYFDTYRLQIAENGNSELP